MSRAFRDGSTVARSGPRRDFDTWALPLLRPPEASSQMSPPPDRGRPPPTRTGHAWVRAEPAATDAHQARLAPRNLGPSRTQGPSSRTSQSPAHTTPSLLMSDTDPRRSCLSVSPPGRGGSPTAPVSGTPVDGPRNLPHPVLGGSGRPVTPRALKSGPWAPS